MAVYEKGAYFFDTNRLSPALAITDGYDQKFYLMWTLKALLTGQIGTNVGASRWTFIRGSDGVTKAATGVDPFGATWDRAKWLGADAWYCLKAPAAFGNLYFFFGGGVISGLGTGLLLNTTDTDTTDSLAAAGMLAISSAGAGGGLSPSTYMMPGGVADATARIVTQFGVAADGSFYFLAGGQFTNAPQFIILCQAVADTRAGDLAPWIIVWGDNLNQGTSRGIFNGVNFGIVVHPRAPLTQLRYGGIIFPISYQGTQAVPMAADFATVDLVNGGWPDYPLFAGSLKDGWWRGRLADLALAHPSQSDGSYSVGVDTLPDYTKWGNLWLPTNAIQSF